MPRPILALALLVPAGVLHAQGSLLLQNIEVLDPTLTVSVTASDSAGDCQAPGIEVWQIPPRSFACTLQGSPNDQAVAADGTIIKWLSDYQQSDPTCVTSPPSQRNALRIFAVAPNKRTREIVRIDTLRLSGCDAGYPTLRSSGLANVVVDLTNGLLRIYIDRTLDDPVSGSTLAHDSGVVTVSGLPQMFDTFLTFNPGGQSLSLLTPAYPDGFRSADSLQVWTGDVRTLPDWSQAQPLTCNAATSPTPGQVVTVPDTLSDPAIGEGRYYVTASQHATDRRLGRQYVNGAFSARDPSTLPVCQ